MLKMRVVGLLGLLAISGMARADLNDGLVAYYSFDDCTARDVSGNGMDGSIKNNVSCTQGIQGSKAIHLQGQGTDESGGGACHYPVY